MTACDELFGGGSIRKCMPKIHFLHMIPRQNAKLPHTISGRILKGSVVVRTGEYAQDHCAATKFSVKFLCLFIPNRACV